MLHTFGVYSRHFESVMSEHKRQTSVMREYRDRQSFSPVSHLLGTTELQVERNVPLPESFGPGMLLVSPPLSIPWGLKVNERIKKKKIRIMVSSSLSMSNLWPVGHMPHLNKWVCHACSGLSSVRNSLSHFFEWELEKFSCRFLHLCLSTHSGFQAASSSFCLLQSTCYRLLFKSADAPQILSRF